jgi:pimeloyl-ACP methyl ester carboxylesterase
MSGRRFVLLHSPLLGPFSLSAAAAELTALGVRAEVPAWPKLSAINGSYYAALARGMASTIDVAGREPVVLVAHSGAGALAPALAAELMAPLAGVIFLDSVLPHPGRSWLDAAPAGTRERLTAGAQMGQLPAWDDWWPPGALSKLLPDPAVLAALVAELEPLPLAYFEEPAPNGDLSALGAAAYLQLSDSYADEARAAGRLGWPMVSLPLHHLGPLSHPKPVASILMSLAGRLAEGGRG